MALFVCLECSCVFRGSTRITSPQLHHGREHDAHLSQTASQIETQRSAAATELTSTSHYLTTDETQQRAALCLTAPEQHCCDTAAAVTRCNTQVLQQSRGDVGRCHFTEKQSLSVPHPTVFDALL